MENIKDCLSCGESMSEPDVDGKDKLFCTIKQQYVDENDYCEEFNG